MTAIIIKAYSLTTEFDNYIVKSYKTSEIVDACELTIIDSLYWG